MNPSGAAETYIEEAYEILQNMEQLLLTLERDTANHEIIDSIFRCLHTIKGSGSMFGFDEVSAFTHEIESLFDKIRQGKIPVTKQIIDMTLASRDYIRFLIENPVSDEVTRTHTRELIADFQRLSGQISENPAPEAPVQETPLAQENPLPAGELKTYRIRFVPNPDLFTRGMNPISLLEELGTLGRMETVIRLDNLPYLEDIDPEKCHVGWDIIISTGADPNALRDVFVFVEGDSKLDIEIIDTEGILEEFTDYKRIGNILYERGDISAEDLRNILSEQIKFGDIAKKSGIVSEEKIESAFTEQRYVRDLRQKRLDQTKTSTIRVKYEKLDHLVNLVGEMVTLQAALAQFASQTKNEEIELISLSEHFERLITELRDNAMEIRMVPIGETFAGFQRLVRDLTADLGKEADLVTRGSETELDKTVIESLKDPLLHILRNSLDHGIETPAERVRQGKPAKGTIILSAEHSGGQVYIRISDDGAGIDPLKIRAKAVEKGVIASDAELSRKEILSLVFLPGFSTAEQATNISGRGVGMDVVKGNIERLRGTVEIESEPGNGTTVLLKIPLTLAIIDGLLLKIGSERFVINLSIIEECVDLTDEIRGNTEGRDIAVVRGEIIPYINLRKLFDIPGELPEIEQMVIVRLDDKKIGLIVDYVIGQYQTVIKNLDKVGANIDEISGATILGDGSIALILDVARIARGVEINKNGSYIDQTVNGGKK